MESRSHGVGDPVTWTEKFPKGGGRRVGLLERLSRVNPTKRFLWRSQLWGQVFGSFREITDFVLNCFLLQVY